VTLHNIRNFAYRTATDFTPRYDDKTCDRQRVESVDRMGASWVGEARVHRLVRVGFGAQDDGAIALEPRKERTQDDSASQGWCQPYALPYVMADDRDVRRLRTMSRQPPAEVSLSCPRLPLARARRLFLDDVREVTQRVEQPAFDHTLPPTCAPHSLCHARASGGRARYHGKMLLRGYAPTYVSEHGGLDTRRFCADRKPRSHLNARAQTAGDAPDCSQRLRAGLPRPAPASR
jgi:hypothetical protein